MLEIVPNKSETFSHIGYARPNYVVILQILLKWLGDKIKDANYYFASNSVICCLDHRL